MTSVRTDSPLSSTVAVPTGAFLTGVFASQIANGALHLAQPLLIAELTGSMGKAAFFSSFDTLVHGIGTAAAGWPADIIGSKRLLTISTLARGVCLGSIPLLWISGRLTATSAMIAYTADAFSRGFVDTAVHALPMDLAGHRREDLDGLNARYEFVFDLSAIVGPSLLAMMLVAKSPLWAQIFVPAGFALGAVAYFFVPSVPRLSPPAGQSRGGGTWEALRLLASRRALWIPALALALLNLYPLRKLLSSFFAHSILESKPAAGWLGAAFGIGGVAGAALYAMTRGRRDDATWVALGAAGTVALAVGWIPGTLAPMAGAAFLFSLANVVARLAVTGRFQRQIPAHARGGAMAVARAGSNLVSVALKALVGVAFVSGAGPRGAFALVGGGLALIAIVQLAGAAAFARGVDSPGG